MSDSASGSINGPQSEEASDLLDPAFLDLLRRLGLHARRRFGGEVGGDRRSLQTGSGLEFADHRAYVLGDDLRHLDWSLLARHDRPYLKRFEQQTDLTVHLIVDQSASMGFGRPTKLWACQRLAAALAHVALAGLDRVGLSLLAEEEWKLRGPFRGAGAIGRLLPLLATAKAGGGATLERGLRLHAGATRPGLTVVFSDFLEPDPEQALRHHRARRDSLVLVQMLAPEELEPPEEGDFQLVDSETGATIELSLGRREREAYLARLQRHQEQLGRFARRRGIDFVSLRSDMPLPEMLLDHLPDRSVPGEIRAVNWGLLHPAWLGLAGLMPLAVLLYLLKLRRESRTVGSLLLWRQALDEVDAQVPFRRLRQHWLLWLQLLILALLALAAARPYERVQAAPTGEAALILDGSASMLVGERAAQARRAARRWVSAGSDSDRWVVLRAGTRPQVLASSETPRDGLFEAIDSYRPSQAPIDGPAAVRLARSIVGAEASVLWIGDNPSAAAELADGVEFVGIADSRPNSGIVRMAVRPTNLSGAAHEAFVALRNDAERPVEGTLELRVNGTSIDARRVVLQGDGGAERTLPIGGVDSGVVELIWSADNRNSLEVDDKATWVLRPRVDRRYRLRGNPSPALVHALQSLDGWRRIDDQATDGASDLDIVVGVPAANAGPALLWIDPPADAATPRPLAASVQRVIDWDATHPTLRFLDLSESVRKYVYSCAPQGPGCSPKAPPVPGSSKAATGRDRRCSGPSPRAVATYRSAQLSRSCSGTPWNISLRRREISPGGWPVVARPTSGGEARRPR